MRVIIDRIDHQGRGIGKIDGKTIFIYNALPLEDVEVEIIKENKKFLVGKVIKYYSLSKDRIDPVCPFYLKCGGCDIMHISYFNQLVYKENKIRQIIDKFTSLNSNVVKPIVGNNIKKYRNKVTFHVNDKIGFYEKESYNIVPIDNCFISLPKINEILCKVKKINLDSVNEVIIRCSNYNNNSMIIFKLSKDRDLSSFLELKNNVDNIIIYQNKEYKTIYGDGFIIDKIGNYLYKISPDSFFQVNTSLANLLYSKVLEYLEPSKCDNVLDLYCGTGTIGIFISQYVKSVKGIEINRYAVKDANYNKKINNIDNISFECLSTSFVSKFKDKFDSVIIDPPRSGLDKKTIDYLINLKAKKIIYVSCDPITLSRDLEILKKYYEIKEITPFDMFSNTYHVECVCVLKLK